MHAPKIIAYLNPFCPWTPGVKATLERFQLAYETIDISRNRDGYEDMVRKSGQHSAPCVEIDGHMLADVGGGEVEDWLSSHGFTCPPTVS